MGFAVHVKHENEEIKKNHLTASLLLFGFKGCTQGTLNAHMFFIIWVKYSSLVLKSCQQDLEVTLVEQVKWHTQVSCIFF